ncbi:PTS sugar transporter subunit IIA [Clostridiaceae bacterium M8S5]|nr:PTS sugar transporter subunit IIA [Clostridiaceae bacterium M8S5]
MIEGFKLNKDFIQFADSVSDWQEAIKLSAKPLLDNGLIEESYIKAMIDSVIEHGPYIVIAPNIALPHARPEAGAKKVGFSILKLKESVAFSSEEDHKAKLLITLSCSDSSTHIEMLQALVAVLSDQKKYDAIFNAQTAEEMLSIFA